MASEVDICNMALGHLGDPGAISSIAPSDGSVQAERCKRFYPIARSVVLEAHAWSFATRRVALSKITNDEKPDSWAFAYAYPNDCTRPLAVLFPQSTDDSDTQDYAVEALIDGSRAIFTNVDAATLRYVQSVTDTTKYGGLVTAAIARLLASYLAGPMLKGVTGQKVSEQHLNTFLRIELPMAQGADAAGHKDSGYRDFVPWSIKVRA